MSRPVSNQILVAPQSTCACSLWYAYHNQQAQIDWYEAVAELAGVQIKLQFFTLRSMWSGAAFHQAYLHATQQAFLAAHQDAFRYFGGVFHQLRYDNLSSAVRKVLRGRRREETDRFIAFRSHWQFDASFCTPGKGHEKGGVEGEDEIQKLLDFLAAARSGSIPKQSGDFVVVAAPASNTDRAALQELLNKLSASGRIDVLTNVLENVHLDSGMLSELLDRAAKHPQLFAEAAAALNLATYKAAVDELHRMITSKSRVPEAEFQQLLAENPWMFGSEYSELLDRRRWTRDEQQDFVVRRTTDGYIELIEIKTPLEGRPLFNHDSSHSTFYAGAELSKVVGQVQNYIEKLDRERNSILANDGEDTTKIRAKIIIGCDGDTNQQHALRRFNGHLHRIEVITFNQLLKIAQKVLDYLEGVLRPNSQSAAQTLSEQSTEEDDFPF